MVISFNQQIMLGAIISHSDKTHCRDACNVTQPKELLNPEAIFTSGSKNSGTSTPSSRSERASVEELALRGGGEDTSRMEESVQSGGRGFMGGVMDTLLNRKRKSVTPESLSVSSEVCDFCLII